MRPTLNIITYFIRYIRLILEPVVCVRGTNGYMVLYEYIIKPHADYVVCSNRKGARGRSWQYRNCSEYDHYVPHRNVHYCTYERTHTVV
jgi:hypothetical protein